MTTTAPATAPAQTTEQVEDGGHVDVPVGAGVSGIGAAHHLREKSPGRTFVMLDARGGIWWTHQRVQPTVDLDDGTLVHR